ncbi:MAG: acyl-ACP--UDP-N-acetylglucosamine O-acyltransferase [bacterium]|nr:acyl-ACP--UDP-N-acetylglucosamine O-acyltransferase [bacterium]
MPEIHHTAIVSPQSDLAEEVVVGPYAIIGDHVRIGKGTRIGSHAHLTGWTEIGEDCIVHTGAVLGSDPQDLKFKGERSFVKIGDRNVFREYTTVNRAEGEDKETIIGDDNYFMAYSHIAHNCHLGNNIIMANCASLAGHVRIDDRAILGGLVGVHQFVHIGCMAMVGGLTKVVQDVPPYMLVNGIPARIFGINGVGLRRLGISLSVRDELKRAYKVLCKEGMNVSQALEAIAKEEFKADEIALLVKFITSSSRGIIR